MGRHVSARSSPNSCLGPLEPASRKAGRDVRNLVSLEGATMTPPRNFVGIDVAKRQLDVALRPTDVTWDVPNDADGIANAITSIARDLTNQ